jgi:creatinine amidohydrolase
MKKKNVAILLLGCFLFFLTSGYVLPASEGPAITTKGYSIFDGTMADMQWPDIETAAKAGAILLFPTGVIEQHGPALATGLDTYTAYIQAKLIKERLAAKGIQALIVPPFYWGINTVSGGFPGSFTVRHETMVNMLVDIFASVKKDGFKQLYLINHHGDVAHNKAIYDAVKRGWAEVGLQVYWTDAGRFSARSGATEKDYFMVIYKQKATPGDPELRRSKYFGTHADESETAIYQHYFPALVKEDILKTLQPTDLTPDVFVNVWFQGFNVARALTPLGYFGDPVPKDPNLWKFYTEYTAAGAAEAIEKRVKTVSEIKPKYGTRD